ncbi:protein pangolin, isoforms A/H/I/S isoform X2 [Drosophila guanche]|uniref:dTCF n=1 Tax=Drosophila guanche TaxID=7266 RepID=A0A3B0KR25_DROGU|nr:protein pangolin, isoforms A/H/I/S isoform X2 [Drosophila guanche]SPP89069.1 blast:Protein pangolin%2C isoforms A/H/I/S [Drosophila guanche]
MPHTHNRHGSSGDDLCSTDEVKIFKDEGDREDEKISSENLLVEEKSSLIDLTESEEKVNKTVRPDHSPVFNKLEPHTPSFNMGYLVSPYPYGNGTPSGLPVTMANKMGLPPFFCHNTDPLTTPPPAHCGIPPYQLDPKAMGLTRPALYPFAAGQYPYPMLSPDMSQVASWHTPSVYSASSFRTPYPTSIPINTTLSSDFPFRFSPSLLPSVHATSHHVLNSHPSIVGASSKQDCGSQDPTTNNRYPRNLDSKNSSNTQSTDCKDSSNDKKKPHIKKPLNAFMLYMKEMRAKVVAECTLKESAAINQILGRRWHALGREEQAKYYELARRERQLHMQMYPDWSSRTNASRGKKRKRKQDAHDGGNNMKKCRARFGLDQQNQWCKPCRRKKKCIRYMEAINGISAIEDGSGIDDLGSQLSDDEDDDDDEDQLVGSCGSNDESNKIPDDDTESLNQSISSPGCLSGLSSLQSPSTTTSLASPLNMNINPATPSLLAASSNALMVVNAEQVASHPRSESVSASGSSSGSTCSISTTPNTSNTVSPVTGTTGPSSSSAHERAMMLGNRFSHLGMGLSHTIGSSVCRKIDAPFQPQPTVSKNKSSANGFNGFNGSIAPSKAPAPSNIARNPIGANPRDINNPLSINQLTKRSEDQNVCSSEISDSQAISALAPTSIIHHATPLYPHHSLFNSSFSQHFHQQLTHHLVAASNIESTLLPEDPHSVNNVKLHTPSDPPTNANNPTSSAGPSETGAISVS